MAYKYYAIYKPFGMLSQFTQEGNKATLGELHEFEKDVYPVGRLDSDSEGLLLLTNDKRVNHLLLNPKHKHSRTYLVQVDGAITKEALKELRSGPSIKIKKKWHHCAPCEAEIMDAPLFLPERNPPIRFRANIPTSWIELSITEGKNRQVRRMTAAVGFPTLRLVRYKIENLSLDHLNSEVVLDFDEQTFYSLCNL